MEPDRTHQPNGKRMVDEQRAETGAAGTVGPSTSALPDPMSRGLWRGGLVGAIVGAAVMTPVAFIPFFDLSFVVRLLIVWVAGFAAGAAVGAVFFGGAVAEVESVDDPQGDADVVPDQMHRGTGAARSSKR